MFMRFIVTDADQTSCVLGIGHCGRVTGQASTG